jgi:nicotinate dehydrogenase subunit B
MTATPDLARREFHKLTGGGVAILFGLHGGAAAGQPQRPGYPDDFHAYLWVKPTGRATVRVGKVEMGQGVMTSFAQMAAEELGVDLGAIDMVMGDTETCPWDMGTFGSLSTRMFGPALRAAAAKARSVLVGLAADRLGVKAEDLRVEHGVVFMASKPSRRVDFGELSKAVSVIHSVDAAAILRAPAAFSVIGRSAPRLDGLEKVTGKARYAADIRLPGMLHASILRPPAHDAILTQLNTAAAQTLPGVQLVQRDDLIAVLHAEPDTAVAALAQVQAEWRTPTSALTTETISDHIATHSGQSTTLAEHGDLGVLADQRFETTYRKGYVAHAPIEPHAALADVRADRATIWASTQTPFPLRDNIAKALGFDPKAVRVITPFLGGGFGGKSAGGQAIEAALLSRACGKPVQVMRTRAEEFFLDTFDPASVVKIRSGLDRDGRIAFWDYAVFAAGERGASTFYDIPNLRIVAAGGTSYGGAPSVAGLHPFSVGPWRAPGANMNVFATESQMDIMAAAAGTDPLAFRLRHITEPRMRRVLEAAAQAFGWIPAVGPSSRGYGIACSSDAGSCVATMAEVKVDKASGKVIVVRIVCAQDMGIVVNPEGARMQVEGGLTMGLGYALSEEVQFQGGKIMDTNFATYHLPRFGDAPPIEVVLVRNDELAPQGCGEPAITTAGAVIANAVFDATGARMLRLPMTPARVAVAIAINDYKDPGTIAPA